MGMCICYVCMYSRSVQFIPREFEYGRLLVGNIVTICYLVALVFVCECGSNSCMVGDAAEADRSHNAVWPADEAV